jgi:small GTP-binding protein
MGASWAHLKHKRSPGLKKPIFVMKGLKVIFVGSAAVGKTSLIYRYMNDQFDPSVPTSLQPAQQSVTIEGVNLAIWDTAGQEKYQALNQLYYRDAVIGCICYSPLDTHSIDAILSWRGDLLSQSPNCKLILVSTKADLVEEEGADVPNPTDLANQNDIPVAIETSAKTGQNVSSLFITIANLASSEATPVTAPVSQLASGTPSRASKKRSCCR